MRRDALILALLLAACVAACRGPRPDFTARAGAGDAAPEAAAEAPPPTRSYRCERAGEAPTLEGTFEDGAWTRAAWTEEFVVVRRRGVMPPVRTRAKMLWDDAYLYCAVELLEPQEAPEPGVPPQRHDVDLMVADDPASGGYQVELVGMGTILDAWHDARNGGRAVGTWDARGLRTSVQRSRDGATQRWTAAFALPWSSLSHGSRAPEASGGEAPKPGAVWRVDLSRTSWRPMAADETGTPEPRSYERAAWQPPAEPAEPHGWAAVEFAP